MVDGHAWGDQCPVTSLHEHHHGCPWFQLLRCTLYLLYVTDASCDCNNVVILISNILDVDVLVHVAVLWCLVLVYKRVNLDCEHHTPPEIRSYRSSEPTANMSRTLLCLCVIVIVLAIQCKWFISNFNHAL